MNRLKIQPMKFVPGFKAVVVNNDGQTVVGDYYAFQDYSLYNSKRLRTEGMPLAEDIIRGIIEQYQVKPENIVFIPNWLWVYDNDLNHNSPLSRSTIKISFDFSKDFIKNYLQVSLKGI